MFTLRRHGVSLLRSLFIFQPEAPLPIYWHTAAALRSASTLLAVAGLSFPANPVFSLRSRLFKEPPFRGRLMWKASRPRLSFSSSSFSIRVGPVGRGYTTVYSVLTCSFCRPFLSPPASPDGQ